MKHVTAEEVDKDTFDNLIDCGVDITGAAQVELKADKDRGVVWVNVNDVCVLRICKIKDLVVDVSK